jgi:hypothetical protein
VESLICGCSIYLRMSELVLPNEAKLGVATVIYALRVPQAPEYLHASTLRHVCRGEKNRETRGKEIRAHRNVHT